MKPCDSCGRPMEPVYPDRCRRRYDIQYDNALGITFHMGYGMFDDPIERGLEPSIVICHDCAHELIDALPGLRKFVDDEQGHTHMENR